MELGSSRKGEIEVELLLALWSVGGGMRGSEDRERRGRRRGLEGDLSFSSLHFGLHPGGFVGSGIGLSGVMSVLCAVSHIHVSHSSCNECKVDS